MAINSKPHEIESLGTIAKQDNESMINTIEAYAENILIIATFSKGQGRIKIFRLMD